MAICSVFNSVFTLNRPSTKIARKHARKGACFFPRIACYRRIVWVLSFRSGEKHAPFSACFHVKGLFSMHVFITNLWRCEKHAPFHQKTCRDHTYVLEQYVHLKTTAHTNEQKPFIGCKTITQPLLNSIQEIIKLPIGVHFHTSFHLHRCFLRWDFKRCRYSGTAWNVHRSFVARLALNKNLFQIIVSLWLG